MMNTKPIKSALISVFYKDGLDEIVKAMQAHNITIYSTGGTEKYIKELGADCIAVENVTDFPSILGGRVKTLHPKMFGGILARRANEQDISEMKEYDIPEIDLVIVDLYPFEETLKNTNEEAQIIEKIDIGGPSMIRAAAKNYQDVAVIADKGDYGKLLEVLSQKEAVTDIATRKEMAAKAFHIVMNYDIAINNYFNGTILQPLHSEQSLRYGENPHQAAQFYGDLKEIFEQLNGKELSYNNLVDLDAAVAIASDLDNGKPLFAILKHTNVCGVAYGNTLEEAWDKALSGDPESAFGGVLISNTTIDLATAEKINELFFEVLSAPDYESEALALLKSKKNRILLQQKKSVTTKNSFKNILNGTLVQAVDKEKAQEWNQVSGDAITATVDADLRFADVVVKHLKSNAIALVKNETLLGKGCGQTSRIDALRQSIDKAKQFNNDLHGAVMSSDAFFPFDDCVKMAHEAGITAVVQPGGSIRDKDSIAFCKENNIAMVLTMTRHFKH